MTGKNGDEHKLEQDQQPSEENELFYENEPNHPGWLGIGEILKEPHPVFNNSKFLIGYHHSSSVYLLAGDYITLVDPGNDYTVFTELDKLGYNILDIKKIVLTHGHRDHCMGVFEFLRYPPVMEKKDIEIILHAGGPDEFKAMITDAGFTPTEVTGGEILNLSGHEWEVIYTPGHTIDGICLFHEPSGTLFSGDTVLPHAMAQADSTAGGRLDHYVYGLKQLMKKKVVHLLPGHGVPVAFTGMRTIDETYVGVMMKVIEASAEEQTTWMEGARKLAEKGFLEEVVYCCDKELGLRPGNPEAMMLKALALNDMGRCDESIVVLDEILADEPNHAFAMAARGHALLGMAKYEESIPWLDKALELDPTIKEAYVFKGMALFFMGKQEEAMQIEEFKSEFLARFKDQIDKRQQEKE